ncbi:MAG: hypothetical protein ACR2JJ_03515 [Sphingomicrobium sp.]
MKRSLVTLIAAALVAAAVPGVPAAAQRSPVPLDHLPALKGDYFPLQSKEADHLYHIYVRLPEGYAANAELRYPIVYLLDGTRCSRSSPRSICS